MVLNNNPLLNFATVVSTLVLWGTISRTIYLKQNRVTVEILILPNEVLEHTLSFTLDLISTAYLSCIILVSTRVLVFTKKYIKGTTNHRRFIYLLLLFVLSIVIIVISERFITLIIGWDGLGLTSFCLVIFYENPNSLFSGILTVLTNRIGDSLFICTIFYLSTNIGLSSNNQSYRFKIITILLIIGCITKRAQIPFCSWLPAAIAAPTPISSLVHSSTLVTAGIFVLIRYHYVFRKKRWMILCLRILTMITAGLCACLESDLKKLIAISTLRQLGLIIITLSVGIWKLTLFHMILHSFFKSLIFLSIGGVILTEIGRQESRNCQPLLNIKFSLTSRITSSICLAGIPFILGFYSKDSILINIPSLTKFITIIIFITRCAVTVAYRLRFIKLTFYSHTMGTPIIKITNRKTILTSYTTLFTFCISLGPLLQSTLQEYSFISRGWNILIGLLILIRQTMLIKLLKKNKNSVSTITRLNFLSWIRTGGVSQNIKNTVHHKIENSWLEILNETQTITHFIKKKINFGFYNSLKFLFTLTPSVLLLAV